MWNVKFNHKNFFLHSVYSNKENEQTKTKLLLKYIKVFICWEVKQQNVLMLVSYSSCYISSLEGDIAEVSKILTSENYFELVFTQ